MEHGLIQPCLWQQANSLNFIYFTTKIQPPSPQRALSTSWKFQCLGEFRRVIKKLKISHFAFFVRLKKQKL